MSEVGEKLMTIEQKHKRFKQQQFIFTTALERSREHAHDRTEPVSSVAQVQRYMNLHCSNATDRRIFLLFLDIVGDLGTVVKLLEPSGSNQSPSGDALETCKVLLGPNCNISKLQAHYPHDEVNRLSCDEARNYYGGVVSLIPLVLDLLQVASAAHSRGGRGQATTPNPMEKEDSPQQPEPNSAEDMSLNLTKRPKNGPSRSRKALSKGIGGWHAGKPAWRPPGRTKI